VEALVTPRSVRAPIRWPASPDRSLAAETTARSEEDKAAEAAEVCAVIGRFAWGARGAEMGRMTDVARGFADEG
jgi:hypothetical protein